MKMNKLTWTAALALAGLMTFGANAQDKPKADAKPAPAGVRPAARIAEELNLTAEQKPKVQAVRRETAEKIKALREDTSLTPEQRREKMKVITEESRTKMKEILTPEQQAKLEELQKNRLARHEGSGVHKKADAPSQN